MSLSDGCFQGMSKYWVLVSILVLMDVSFRRGRCGFRLVCIDCFHPCFNGCVFQTYFSVLNENLKNVSILVLMDVSFRQKMNQKEKQEKVSILVLMDVSFRQ